MSKPMGKFDISAIKKPKKQGIIQTQETEKKARAKPSTKRKVGRRRIEESRKLSEGVFVAFRKSEIAKLKNMSKENFNVPLPRLIRNLLKQGGYI